MDKYLCHRILLFNGTMQMKKTKVEIMKPEEGEKILKKELAGCTDAEYVFSKVMDISQKEVMIPVILMKDSLKNKEEYIDVPMHSSWSAINWNMNEREAWMFLNIDFENLGFMKFKFNLLDAKVRKWIETLINANGNAVLCDKNEKTDFDVGLSNIPLDIPIALMRLTAFSVAMKRLAVGG